MHIKHKRIAGSKLTPKTWYVVTSSPSTRWHSVLTNVKSSPFLLWLAWPCEISGFSTFSLANSRFNNTESGTVWWWSPLEDILRNHTLSTNHKCVPSYLSIPIQSKPKHATITHTLHIQKPKFLKTSNYHLIQNHIHIVFEITHYLQITNVPLLSFHSIPIKSKPKHATIIHTHYTHKNLNSWKHQIII